MISAVPEAFQEKVVPPTFEVRVTSEVRFPEQTVWFIGLFVTIGLGSTVITAVCGVPSHPPIEGMMVYVTVP